MMFREYEVQLWGHILLNMPVYGSRSFDAFEEFCRDCRALTKLAEEECNRSLTEKEEKRRDRLRADVEAYCKTVGMVADFYGDPRGYVVKVKWPDLGENTPSNTWGGPVDGWGVG